MKKMVSLALCMCIVLCLVGCSVDVNQMALQSNYDVDNENDFVISQESGLGLKLVEYSKNNKVYMLAYLNDENMLIDSENQYIKSLVVGKTCISSTSTVLDVGRCLNKEILVDLITRLNNQLNDDSAVKISENLGDESYYIISKNDTYAFIDYLTTIPNKSDKVLYNRFIIQDVSLLDEALTEEEIAVLPDFLPELLEVLNIEESIELPKK